ncbi:MAG TPA: hypothetical protein VMS19_04680 [Methyloceanibacter sp.]|nr:hypothetical protein [Methyloceanibacter sp.]
MTRQRLLLIVLLAWALVMIVPDLLRVAQPLGSFGFYADNDGLIYNVTGPFDAESDSPAWNAGIRDGDKLYLGKLHCFPYSRTTCRNALMVLGGLQLVLPGREATFELKATGNHPARQVTLKAAPVPANPFERFILLIDQIAGILVVVAAAWLVWTRPGAMSWGFFLYVIWFNPGQVYAFYALLQPQPLLLLAQNLASAVAEAVGYVGLILFVLRAPDGEPDRKWRWLERILPVIAIVLAVLLLLTYGNLTGYRTETGTRFAILAGFAVAVCAVGILLERTRRKPPEDFQRMRWVVWGCLIGLPAFLIAELASSTTIFDTKWGDVTPSEDVIGLLYLVNGILCLFVFEAVRRERVVSVSIPLRRVTILGLTLSIPALLLHHEVEYMQQHLAIPNWAWIVIGAGALYLITRLHEGATHVTDRYFNRDLDHAERNIAAAILKAKEPLEVDRILAEKPYRALKLSSAASFRRNGAEFRRDSDGHGWGEKTTRTLSLETPMLAPVTKGVPFAISEEDKSEPGLPGGFSRPVLVVPAANPLRCFALALYGPHASGADLDANERAMLKRIGQHAAAVYAEIENDELRHQIATLERKMTKSGATKRPKRGKSP